MHARLAYEVIASAHAIIMVSGAQTRVWSLGHVLTVMVDRQLHKVAPKGRPVSQCQHCRGLRKARAQHVKCDCAEKGHSKADCPHEKAEHNGEKSGTVGHQPLSDLNPAESHSCCCTHGSRCSCSLKKEHHLDPVPEDAMCDMSTPDSGDLRPRSSIHTPPETKMTVFQNGHHKPVHKLNDAAHTRGMPYTIPRPHSIHGHSEIAQRSVDSLPHTKRSLISEETPQHHDSITSAPQPVRRVKSEHGSPELKATKDSMVPIKSGISQLDAQSYSPYGVFSGTNSPDAAGLAFSGPEQFSDSYFGYPSSGQDFETPLHSAGLNAPSVDWSSFNLPYDPEGEYVAAPSQPPSYASFDYGRLNQPGLTSSSGEISEAEDFPTLPEEPLAATSVPRLDSASSVERPAQESPLDSVETDTYRLSSASSVMGMPPRQSNTLDLLRQDNINMDIDDFIRKAEEETRVMEAQNRRNHAGSIGQNDSPVRTPPKMPSQTDVPLHGLTVHEAQHYAHMGDGQPESSEPAVKEREPPFVRQISSASVEDPMWSNPDAESPEEVKWES